jgi:hypothetical protein
MLNRKQVLFGLIGLTATCVLPAPARAQKQPLKRQPDRQLLADEEVKDMVLLMDTDKNGKISKDEWMKFMGKEFDRLDTDKSGSLDVKEIAQSKLRPARFANAGK